MCHGRLNYQDKSVELERCSILGDIYHRLHPNLNSVVHKLRQCLHAVQFPDLIFALGGQFSTTEGTRTPSTNYLT